MAQAPTKHYFTTIEQIIILGGVMGLEVTGIHT
jgi:hypothetical protein